MTDRLVYRVPEVCKMLGIGRSTFYRWAESGEMSVIKVGSLTFVNRDELERLRRERAGSVEPMKAQEVYDGRVYFIDDGFFIKIGFSKRPQVRITKLQTASPFKLALMRTILGNKKLEADLHARFRHLKSHGEWFRGELELRRYIREMTS